MVFLDGGLDVARLGGVDDLVLQVLALGTHAARSIHTLLELIILPAKDVISVLTVAGVVAVAEVEWLGSVRGPLALVVEGSGVPDNLVHELRNPDGVGGWAAASQAKEVGRAGSRVGNVRLVVWAVQVLSVPAAVQLIRTYTRTKLSQNLRREEDVGADSTLARCGWQGLSVELSVSARCGVITSKVGAGVASVAVLHLHLGVDLAVGWVTDEHAESLSN